MINWGFIGCGDVVVKKSGKPFNWEGKSKVVAVMCRSKEKAKIFAETYGIEEYYDDAEKIFNNDKIDAVYIATTPNSHMPYAKRAIECGKAVYVEKPMGINFAECEEVLSLAKDKNIPFFIAYYRRALPYFTRIKSMIESKEIGDIRCVNVIHHTKKPEVLNETWRRNPSIAGGGLFHDVACHTLDILDFLIAPIGEVYSFNANQRKLFNSDDTVSCVFEFENGVMGTGVWCFDVESSLETVQIIGDEGKLEFPVFGDTIKLIKNEKIEEIKIPYPAFVQEPMVHNVIDSLRGEINPLSTGQTAIRTENVMRKIFAM